MRRELAISVTLQNEEINLSDIKSEETVGCVRQHLLVAVGNFVG